MDTNNPMTREELIEAYARGERDFSELALNGIDLSGLDLSEINLSNSNLNGANLVGTNFSKANLTKADISGAAASRANFSDAEMGWCLCVGTDLIGADFRRVTAQGTNFTNALGIRAHFDEADCLGAIFTNMNAMAAQFTEANLECADMTQANLSNALMEGVNAPWCNFNEARLNWANLSWAQLEAASFEGANLTGACLRAANLSFANLSKSFLLSADAYFANLSGTMIAGGRTGIANVSSARITYQTFSRSEWTREDLREWQNRGASILDFEAFPKDVQDFIRQGRSNLHITFSTPVRVEEQSALESLIFLLFGDDPKFRILSVDHDQMTSTVAFRADHDEDIERFTTAIRKCTWRLQQEVMLLAYRERCLHADSTQGSIYARRDIISILNRLCNNVMHIQALVPVDEDDHIRIIAEQMADASLTPPDKTSVTWSSVSNHRIRN